MGFKMRKQRTVFFTIVTFGLAVFMVLNLMMVRISPEDGIGDKISFRKQIRGSKKAINVEDEFHNYFVAQGQRKPKTTNLEDDSENNVYEKETYHDSSEKLDHTYYQNEANDQQNIQKVLKDKDRIDYSQEKYQESVKYKDNQDGVLNFEKQNNNNKQTIEAIEDIDDEYDDDYNEEEDLEEDDDDDDDDEYEYDDKTTYKTNRPFQPGDFGDLEDYGKFRKPQLQFEEVVSNAIIKEVRNQPTEKKLLQTQNGWVPDLNRAVRKFPKLVEDEIFWSPYVESLIPKGMSYKNITKLISSLRKQYVKTLEQPTWDRCGRPKNGFIILGDNTTVCARYRQPHKAFVFGEVLSFYLSRLLGMDNVPAVILAKTDTASRQWSTVDIRKLEWEENKTIAFIQWIDHLNSGLGSKSYIPPLLLHAYTTGKPIRREDLLKFHLQHRDPASLVDLAQWGTMIIFDYLTGNYDRVASMQDAAEKEHNPHIIEEAIRNLPKSAKDNKLWLIDNESGLLDAYHLLQSPKRSSTRFTKFHREMLQSTCVFQNSVVQALLKLTEHPSPHARLMNFATSHEPLMSEIPKDRYYKLFETLFEKRLRDVKEWVIKCQRKENS